MSNYSLISSLRCNLSTAQATPWVLGHSVQSRCGVCQNEEEVQDHAQSLSLSQAPRTLVSSLRSLHSWLDNPHQGFSSNLSPAVFHPIILFVLPLSSRMLPSRMSYSAEHICPGRLTPSGAASCHGVSHAVASTWNTVLFFPSSPPHLWLNLAALF